jgi:ABC-type branched-subunit amino acid transport system substrate-binding protein
VATVKKTVDAGVICFAPYGAAALIRKASGDSPLLFTTNLHYDTTTAAGLKWTIAKLGSKKVGFIYQEGPFGDLVGKGVREGLASKGWRWPPRPATRSATSISRRRWRACGPPAST